MLSISPLKSASSATKYYLGEENPKNLPDVSLEKDSSDNYYLKEKSQDENTFWFGELAKESGLNEKPVDEKNLESVLSGHLGEEVIKGKRDNHKAGFDLTFSAPKSVSILALVGGDTRLIEAHNNAVKFTLTELEKDVAQVTHTKDKGEREYQNTQSMLFAVVRHKTSRANEPQVHSHALAANMTRNQEGELRTLASSLKQKGGVINGSGERIYNFQKYYTALYQSHLAKESQELGFQTQGIGNGQFDIKGVPSTLMDAFSTRKQQIDQQTLEFGHNTQATRETAALNTRQSKTYQSEAALNGQWQSATLEQGLDPAKLVEKAKEHAKNNQSSLAPANTKQALLSAIEHLSQYTTTLNLEKVIELAASDFTKGSEQPNAIDLKKTADSLIKDGTLVGLKEKGQYTSKSMLQNEKALMDITKGRAHHMRTHVEPSTLTRLDIPTNQQQKLTELYHSTKQFHVVNVFGSSEKIAQQLLNVGNHSGKRVQFVSQGAKATHQGKKNIQRESHTLKAWITQVFQPEQRHSLNGILNSKAELTNKDVLVVDDANKMSANELITLTEKAKQTGSKVMLLNRTSSRQGFKAHNAIDLYSKGNVESHNWVNNTTRKNQIKLHDNDAKKVARIYSDLPDKANTQVLATSSVEQRKLTGHIRDALKNTGELSRTETTLFTQVPHFLSKSQQPLAQHYKVGMTLTQWENGKPKAFVVASTDKANNTILTVSKQDGKPVTLDPASKSFKAMNVQLSKPQSINIAKGERLATVGKHFPSGLEAHQSYQVTGLSKHSLTLEDTQGQTLKLSIEKLKDAPLQYDYVQNAHNIDDKTHTLLSAKAFTLSKALLNDLSEKTDRLDIFTDNTDKARSALEKTTITPSAIERVMQTQHVNDRYLSGKTEDIVRQDVSQALSMLSEDKQRPTHEKAVSFALNHLSEREAGFSQKELVVEAVRYAFEEAGSPITKAQVEETLDKRQDALSAEYSDGTRWTTQAALDTEKHILANIEKGKDQHLPFATSEQVESYLDDKPRLSAGQKDSITLISTTHDSIVAIQGLAGTGKSTMLESNIDLIEHTSQVGQNKPKQIIGLAPTHAAVSELQKKGVEAQTLESLLTDLRRGTKEPNDYQGSLFFLDESSMVSNKQAKDFTDLIINSQSKAVLLGDKEQLLSLSAGKPFELAMRQGNIDTAQMTDIVRQQNDTLLNAVHNILDKQPDSALDKLQKQAPDPLGKTEHVISTLEPNNKDPRQAQQTATEKLPYVVAQDYLSRTPETRESTLIIAYTNVERDNITEHIREGLIGAKEIGQENVVASRLRSIGATGEELSTMMPYQKGLILSTKPGEYATITGVDSEHGIVTLKNEATGREKTFFPRNRDHTFTTLFSLSHQPLSKEDKIITRFTDKTRDIKANVEYRVQSADEKMITALSESGKLLTLNPNELKDAHWDYAYTRTADMAQGTTYPHVITAIQGKGGLTNLRRAYIDLTRASTHLTLYTDNPKQMVKTWQSKESNKHSAIETVNQIPPQSTTYFNRNALPHEDVRYQNKSGEFDYNLFKERINTELPKYTESLAKQLLGKPNLSKSDRDYLTFGIGKSAIKVSLTGEYRGYFKDYTTGEKGSLINLIMSHKDISYKEAMNNANEMINEPDKHQIDANEKHEKLLKTTPRHIAQFEERAKEYIEQSQPMTGTLAEKYLNKLGISDVENKNVRFHPSVYSSEDRTFHPAIVTNIHNKQGETKAIEVTYLDGQGEKDSALDINPRTLGTKSKNLTQFNNGEHRSTTIISTDIESSFIINQETKGQIDIINVNHKNDIQNVSIDELRQNIIIVLGQGNHDLNPNNIEKIMANFSNRDIQFISSENLKHDIIQCVNDIERKEGPGTQEINDHLEVSDVKENSSSTYNEKNNIDSKALEYFEQKDISPQLDLDINKEPHREDREIDREFER
ncbi:conjugative transfer relaxase/helicase TraI (plasmid) [Vibrio lentus]|uniref:conjugative transfer relaxase/helicase TraI n=1 Tax=Vibrio lentus TaxID=136468 RepID=UPI000C862765|nr:conjugative transfer relaxase/helicase TraI [Vibrio lentus]PMH62450.1 conjugative transfer relaxase/helicase TraI [Vibrio lentus]PMM49980.1 conjugative transfer relaxase/helicase TraI [Vibrio lentus]